MAIDISNAKDFADCRSSGVSLRLHIADGTLTLFSESNAPDRTSALAPPSGRRVPSPSFERAARY
jgi:hypothetical protein